MQTKSLLLLLLSSSNLNASAFTIPVPPFSSKTCSNYYSQTALASTSDYSSDPTNPNNSRLSVLNLLTQRSIQSFMYLCDTCRDPHSVTWMENTLQTSNQLSFHGTGAGYLQRFGGNWDGPLREILKQEKQIIIIAAKRRGNGHGGWSTDNPHLKERFVEFEIDIDPVSLVSRILSVREQIAQEWCNGGDLNVFRRANAIVLESYFARLKENRSGDEKEVTGFERTAALSLNNHTSFCQNDGASSPFRKGNFDLLCNLCTQVATHRVLHDLRKNQISTDDEVAFEWLRDFYANRVSDYFDGDLRYGRADDFLEDLMEQSPALVKRKDYGRRKKVGLADPMGLAEKIIQKRNEVIDEWKILLAEVPKDHAEIRKVVLAKQMEAWGSKVSQNGDTVGLGNFE